MNSMAGGYTTPGREGDSRGRMYYIIYSYYFSKYFELLATEVLSAFRNESFWTRTHLLNLTLKVVNLGLIWNWLEWGLGVATYAQEFLPWLGWGCHWTNGLISRVFIAINTACQVVYYHFYYTKTLASSSKRTLGRYTVREPFNL